MKAYYTTLTAKIKIKIFKWLYNVHRQDDVEYVLDGDGCYVRLVSSNSFTFLLLSFFNLFFFGYLRLSSFIDGVKMG